MRIQIPHFMMPKNMRLWKKDSDKNQKLNNNNNPFTYAISFKKEEITPWSLPNAYIKKETMFSSIAKKSAEDSKIRKILKKIARGEQLSVEETAYLEKIEPEKIQKAKAASQRRKAIEDQLVNAKTKEEAESVLALAKQEALSAFNNEFSKEYGEYLMDAISKVEEKYRKEKRMDSDIAVEKTMDIRI